MPRYTDLFPVECRLAVTGTGQQTLDAVSTDAAWGAEWEVVARETGTGNTESRIFRAIHNGANVTKSEFAHMVMASPIDGLQLDATLIDIGGGYELRLLGSATNEVDFRVLRKSIG